MIDPLTRIGNRRYAEIQLDRSLSEMNRYGWTFAVFFMDIDHFKTINDTHGHDTGDRVLRTVAKTIVKRMRPSDVFGRWGGEEFLAIVPNCGPSEIVFVGNKMRSLVEQSRIWNESDPVRVTLSIGGTSARPEDSVTNLISRADKLMYCSKENGRNRVTTDVTAALE